MHTHKTKSSLDTKTNFSAEVDSYRNEKPPILKRRENSLKRHWKRSLTFTLALSYDSALDTGYIIMVTRIKHTSSNPSNCIYSISRNKRNVCTSIWKYHPPYFSCVIHEVVSLQVKLRSKYEALPFYFQK